LEHNKGEFGGQSLDRVESWELRDNNVGTTGKPKSYFQKHVIPNLGLVITTGGKASWADIPSIGRGNNMVKP
jgi:hypothetical protein